MDNGWLIEIYIILFIVLLSIRSLALMDPINIYVPDIVMSVGKIREIPQFQPKIVRSLYTVVYFEIIKLIEV